MKNKAPRLIARRVLATAMAVSTSWALVGPSFALAADSFTFNGEDTAYTDPYTNDDGSFTWDGGDNFALNDYAGPGWVSNGTANVDVSGTNAVEGSIAAAGGDLTITGDAGSEEDTLVVVNDESFTMGGVAAIAGDVNIENTSVVVESESDIAAITATDGNVNIKDADVAAYNTGYGHGIAVSDGSVNITDSNVIAATEAEDREAIVANATGEGAAPEVNIENSNVYAEAPNGDAAIVAYSYTESNPGRINITNSYIESPAGAHVTDVAITEGSQYGQTLSTGDHTIDSADDPSIVKEATILATSGRDLVGKKANDTAAKKIKVADAAKKLAKTSDSTANGVAALAAIGALVTTGAVMVRKRVQE